MKNINHSELNTIGGIPFFTIDGAIEAYKLLARRCYNGLSLESSCVLDAEAEKLVNLGFTPAEIEGFEIDAIAEA